MLISFFFTIISFRCGKVVDHVPLPVPAVDPRLHLRVRANQADGGVGIHGLGEPAALERNVCTVV